MIGNGGAVLVLFSTVAVPSSHQPYPGPGGGGTLYHPRSLLVILGGHFFLILHPVPLVTIKVMQPLSAFWDPPP